MTKEEIMGMLESIATKLPPDPSAMMAAMYGAYIDEEWKFSKPQLEVVARKVAEGAPKGGWTPETVTLALLATDGRYSSKQDQAIKLIQLLDTEVV